MKQKLETLTSAKAKHASAKAKHADLLAQCDRIKEVEERNRTAADSLRAQLNDAEAAHRNCEKQHIRGLASADELAEAGALMNGLRENLTEAERMAGLAQDALAEMQGEILSAKRLMQSALAVYCRGANAGISATLNGDTKIRAMLLEAYGALVAAETGYEGVWCLFLDGIFEMPTRDEIKTATAEFRLKHHLS